MKRKIPAWQRTNRDMARMYRYNTLARQEEKKMLDGRLAYSADEEALGVGTPYEFSATKTAESNWTRLLDEGVILECDGTIDSVIAKGTIKRWFEALPDDYEGNIDKDHNRSIDLGLFHKDDLKLVELGNGRYGVDVNVKLNPELHAVQDLVLMNNRKAISSEFFAIDGGFLKASDILGEKLKKDYSVPLITEIAITGYGVVSTPLNANSYDDGLLQRAFSAEPIDVEGTDMDPELEAKKAEELAEAEKAAEDAKAENAEESEEKTEDTEAAAEGAEEADKAEEKTEAEEADEKSEAADGEETADEAEQKDAAAKIGEDVTEESIDECKEASAATLDELQNAIETLKKDLAAKDAKIAELESKLSNTKVVQNDFQARLAKMLNFATSTEPTSEEGKETPAESEDKKEGDAVVDAYAAAFANL